MPLLEQVLERNPETVKLVYKSMPLTRIHQMAMPAAKAAFAAREQGKFWEFHDRLFSVKPLTAENITKIAEELHLDMARFQADMASAKVQGEINKDMLDAQKAGVTGTPTVYINGHLLKQRSPEGFQVLIDEELRKLGKLK